LLHKGKPLYSTLSRRKLLDRAGLLRETLAPGRAELDCRVPIAAPLHEGTESPAAGLFCCRMANGAGLAVCLFSRLSAEPNDNSLNNRWHEVCSISQSLASVVKKLTNKENENHHH
jgi:hypothetical protein